MTTARRSRKRRASKPPARVSLRQLAGRLGVSEGAVRKRLRTGGFSAQAVVRGPNGRPLVVDVALATREWQANRAKPTPHPIVGVPDSTTPPGSLTDSQIRVNFQREVKLELENLQKRGILIDAACERRKDFESARTVRDSMMNIPDRNAARLAAETDATAVHRILTEEIRGALVALADALDAADSDPDARGGADAA